jgi:hypothetical protein
MLSPKSRAGGITYFEKFYVTNNSDIIVYNLASNSEYKIRKCEKYISKPLSNM